MLDFSCFFRKFICYSDLFLIIFIFFCYLSPLKLISTRSWTQSTTPAGWVRTKTPFNMDEEEDEGDGFVLLMVRNGLNWDKGLAVDTIASLPSFFYRAQDKQDANMEQCVICRVEFDEGKSLVALPCEHPYHSECINQWPQLNK
ncbi:hypothetical protein ACJX0J_008693, partial [Zea mays]